MKRRDFITLIGGVAIAWPLAARAQQTERMRRVGVLMNFAEGDREAMSWIDAFYKRLQELGWRKGQNIQIDERWAAGDADRRRQFATDLVSLEPDVIFGFSTPTIAALQRATRTIPIVFVNANNPVGSGFVSTLARPGGNVTGFVSNEPSMGGKWLEILKEVAPQVAAVMVLYNPQTHTGQYFEAVEASAQVLSMKAIRLPYRSATDIERGIEQFANQPNGSLLVPPDSSNTVHRGTIIQLAERYRLPAIYFHRLFTNSGGLASYGSSYSDASRKGAEYVDRILRGAKPGELPVQAPTKFELVISLKAAKRIGLTVAPIILARADEVIE
jgi:ABC-type uncharacterized transport system substrate-binding protein